MWRLISRTAHRRARHFPGRFAGRASGRSGVVRVVNLKHSSAVLPAQQQRFFVSDFGNDEEPAITADDMEFFDEFNKDLYDFEEDDVDEDDEQEEERLRQEIRDELDQRKGREWSDPWEITEEEFMQKRVLDDLPDWTPGLVSRISLERVKIHPDGIPTLSALATVALPPPPAPHPVGGAKAYGKHRKRYIQSLIDEKVVAVAKPKIPSIIKLPTWEDKQNAIDELYESVEAQLKEKEEILGRNPHFGAWVEHSLEEYLKRVDAENRKQKDTKDADTTAPVEPVIMDDDNAGTTTEDTTNEADGESAADTIAEEELVIMDDNNAADPVFMDLYDSEDGPELVVPTILHPLKPHERDGPGRMVEEWELSAHKETKRILLRQCTRQIAQVLQDNNSSRVYVHGRQGVGKSAALTAIVGSARKSGYIVLYLPEGNRLRRHGKYVEPNLKRKGIFDLPVLAQEVCEQLLFSHRSDLEGFVATQETLDVYFTEDQRKRIEDDVSLASLLETAQEKRSLASMCYAAVVHTLMAQDEKPFLMVLDEFNCYYDYGHYFHMEYDETVRKWIPYNQISLFQPALDAMGLSASNDDDDETGPTVTINRGGIVVGTTESHAVARKFTDALTESAVKAQQQRESTEAPLVVVDVPRYSHVEADHIISNMECIGIGRLRFDRGDTVMNKNEMGYLRMVSGGVGQRLMDACIL